MEDKPKIIFWGTPEFALPAFEALLKNGYDIVAVVTNPDESVGRKQILTSPPVKVWAEKYGIPVLQPYTLANFKLPAQSGRGSPNDIGRQITNCKPDLFVVAGYGKIIPKEIIELPRFGSLNIHPSLLPRWRGPSPIQYTILEGDTETGVTMMLMDEKMDHGPIIANSKFKIQNSKITYTDLYDRLAKLGAELLVEVLPKWLRGEIASIPQDDAETTYSKILKKEDGRIDWTSSAIRIERMIRAFIPWPGVYTFWQRDGNKLRLNIEEAETTHEDNQPIHPGFVWQKGPDSMLVQSGEGSLRILRIHPEGKKTLSAREFLNGYRDIIGITLE